MRDKSGSTPFAKALIVKDNAAGLAILNREPKAAEQVGQTGWLGDIEWTFLLFWYGTEFTILEL